MPSKTIKLKFEKETKRTIRFEEIAENSAPIIGTLYVSKLFLGDKKPESVMITLAVQGIDYSEEGKEK